MTGKEADNWEETKQDRTIFREALAKSLREKGLEVPVDAPPAPRPSRQ